jgi:D-lyxose ketol-isomerase
MKRSEINTIMGSADQFIRSRSFYLPPFAYWKPEEWRSKGPEVPEIVANHLGWDITDFGKGDFTNYGPFLFTLRNGSPSNWKTLRGKLYAEKIMIVEENQYTPYHFYWNKMEDIIYRGGGNLMIQLYNATPREDFDMSSPVMLAHMASTSMETT